MNNPGGATSDADVAAGSLLRRRGRAVCLIVFVICGWTAALLTAQDVPVGADAIRAIQQPSAAAQEVPAPPAGPTGIDLLTLIGRGGALMYPILFMSLLVVTLGVERLVSLRRRRVIPPQLVADLARLRDPVERFDPAAAYAACRRHPSPASRVIAAMLQRTGQPLGEAERVATETAQREADNHTAPIRWLNLSATATPLMGLLGTVWGMILAFHESTTLTPDRSRSEQLSEGIYTALVTTLAGLAVAIPAAMIAQHLENRLAKLFHEIEELAFAVAPGLERFIGRARMDPDRGMQPLGGIAAPPTTRPSGKDARPEMPSGVEKGGSAEKAVRSS